MKTLLTLTFLLTFCAQPLAQNAPVPVNMAKLQELDVEWELLDVIEVNELNRRNIVAKRKNDLTLLRRVKQLIIGGDTDAAKYYLNKLDDTNKAIQNFFLFFFLFFETLESYK